MLLTSSTSKGSTEKFKKLSQNNFVSPIDAKNSFTFWGQFCLGLSLKLQVVALRLSQICERRSELLETLFPDLQLLVDVDLAQKELIDALWPIMTVTCQKSSVFFPLLNPFVYVVSHATSLDVFLWQGKKISC